MDIIIERAMNHIKCMKLRPEMYSSCKEAFLAECSGILTIISPEFNAGLFYTKFLNIKGNAPIDMYTPFTKKWAEEVANEAINIIKISKLVSFK